MTSMHAKALAVALTLTLAPILVSQGHAAKQCKDGYKWSESEKKCVLDPFGGNDY